MVFVTRYLGKYRSLLIVQTIKYLPIDTRLVLDIHRIVLQHNIQDLIH